MALVINFVNKTQFVYDLFQVELKEGPLDQFTHEMEPFLRKQGMPVRLNKGIVLHFCVIIVGSGEPANTTLMIDVSKFLQEL